MGQHCNGFVRQVSWNDHVHKRTDSVSVANNFEYAETFFTGLTLESSIGMKYAYIDNESIIEYEV